MTTLGGDASGLSEPARRELAAKPVAADWEIGHRVTEHRAYAIGMWRKPGPAGGFLLIRDASYGGLERRLEAFGEVYAETGDVLTAEAAALDLET